MSSIQPFTINVPQSDLDDLQSRLKATRFTDEPDQAGWNYGMNPSYLRELVDYWQHRYDWRQQEAALNRLPQFKIDIDGLTIHFLHVKGSGPSSRPLLLTHGWPDSFYRFCKVIPLLTDPGSHGGEPAESFDVIVPSIPGFGFSSRVAMNTDKVAELFQKLMNELGYREYLAAGGDLGSTITKSLAVQFPESVKAIHLTDVGYPTGFEDWSTMSPAEQEFGKFIQHWWYTEGAYNMIQSTKPQTLGYGLNDSPAGLAAWILEKFYTWSDCKGNIENSFTKDELITNIMIYWVTQTINTSARAYLEEARAVYTQPGGLRSGRHVGVPTGVAIFPAEAPVPREWADRKVNVQRFTKMQEGGHFATLEKPGLWVGEIRAFFVSLSSNPS